MNLGPWLLLVPVILLAAPSAAAVGGHYVPQSGDRFDYYETYQLGSGSGNYSNYYENTFINGTIGVTGTLPNGTESASYSNSDSWSNVSGTAYQWTSSGDFSFSAATFAYVQGTDNQTGYTNPLVWFYVNNSLPEGAGLTLLNTNSHVVSTDYSYALGSPYNENVATIFVEGTGTFNRNDIYGVFTASYDWKTYFDPTTGYIVGYVYVESDTDPAGDGFVITDSLAVTSTTYALTQASASTGSSSSGGISTPLLIGLVVLVIVIVLVVVVLLVLTRRRSSLPRHSARGNIGFGPPPGGPSMGIPPPVHLTPSGQPGVQQIVVRETVKVACRYCGTLIDSTATVCPVCGAPRT